MCIDTDEHYNIFDGAQQYLRSNGVQRQKTTKIYGEKKSPCDVV
jgi:hypothetical protein